MQSYLEMINTALWGNVLLFLLFAASLVILVRSRFAPIRNLFRIHPATQSGKSAKSRISTLQACTASLAAAMGTGNLVGVAAAISIGGAGAVFWMWIAALLGMVLLYAENVLSCRYRSEEYPHICGAIAYLRYGLHQPRIAALFAFLCTAASFGMGNMTQSNAMAQTMEAAFHIPPLLTGIAAAGITGIVILGGSKRIGTFTQAAVPFLSVVYLAAACAVIWNCREQLPHACSAIFREAFGISAIGGGICGAAVRQAVSVGLRRGIFSTEAGLGSSGILHGEAAESSPERLGQLAMLEAFIDTFLCCTATALAILTSGVTGMDGGALLLAAFTKGIGNAAGWILPPILVLFAICTLIGWSYCGMTAFSYLTGGKFCRLYQIGFCIAAVIGAVMQLQTVWTLADIANACMAYCNLPALLLLSASVGRTERVQ